MKYRRHYREKIDRENLKILLPEIFELKRSQNIDLSSYKDKPIAFLQEVLGIDYLTPEQKRISLSVLNNQTTNVQAAHGLGKSFLVGGLILWWHFAVNGVAVSTAPTFNQVKDILWKEVRTLYDRNKDKLGGRRTTLTLESTDPTGREILSFGKASKNYDSNSFQGLHEDYLMLIQDEADGITDTIDEAFESCLTGSNNRGIRIGNPLNGKSSFANNCKISNIKIPVWDHPNVSWAYEIVKDEQQRDIHRLKPKVAIAILKPPTKENKNDPVKPQSEWGEDLPRDRIPGAVSIAWIEKQRVKYGEFSAYWMPRIEAEFPGDDVEGIIPISWLKQARERYDKNPEYWDAIAKLDKWRIGVDVSDGRDNHAIALWRGCVLYQVDLIKPLNDREDTITLADKEVEPLVNSLGGLYQIAVDNTGVGAGTLGTLKKHGYFAIPCKFGESAQKKSEFSDRKSELFWQFREDLRDGKIAIAPLGEIEEEVFEDLSSVRYNTDTQNKIKCEEKKETRKRIKRSPDAGDAVIIAGEIPVAQQISFPAKEQEKSIIPSERQAMEALLNSAKEWNDEISTDAANKYLI